MNKNKQLGMLLGLHCGDSLGATLEFGNPINEADKQLKKIVGGGAFNWRPGEATDDTDLMICVLKSIQENKLDIEYLQKQMIDWYKKDPKDIGMTTRKAIEKMMGLPSDGIKNVSLSNGSLMRCAPLSLLQQDPETITDIIKKQHDLTHAMEDSLKSDMIYIMTLQLILSGKDKNFIYNSALNWCQDNFKSFHVRLKLVRNTPWKILPTSGFVMDGLFTAFWSLMNCETFEEAIVLVVNRGDDADTCGAIAGAMCGAYYGVDAIPEQWLEKIQRKNEIISELDRILKA